MKLLVRRDQKKGMLGMGSIVFQLDARAELSAQEREWVNKYKMGKTLLYNHKDFVDRSSSAVGSFFAAVAHRMTNIQVTVEDLVNGKHIEVKDIVEMLAVEEQLKQAADTFNRILHAAGTFGGEELFEFNAAA